MRIIPRKSCLRVFSRACPFPPRSPSLFSITLSGPQSGSSSSHRLPCLPNTLLPPLSSPLPSAPSPSKSLPPRRGENERAHMYARIIRAAAPRSLIVHRNRNCVPASHACGLPVLCPAPFDIPSDSPFVRSGFSTLPSASFQTIRRSPVTFGEGSARSTNRTSVSIASDARN